MVLSDTLIRWLCQDRERPMITPFSEGCDDPGVISYGLSSAGYDIRLSHEEVWRFSPSFGEIIRPKLMRQEEHRSRIFRERSFSIGEEIIIPANSYILGKSVETFCIPRHVLGICLGKSSYARAGILVNVTPLEPDWRGVLTIEVANTSPLPAVVYAGEGIAQIVFHHVLGNVGKSYADKKGKYMDQAGVVGSLVRE